MKANLHPKLHEVTFMIPGPDGAKELKALSTYSKDSGIVKCDIGPFTHPAWTGKNTAVVTAKKVAKFNSRFGACFDTVCSTGNADKDS